jgi:hypothetical protein
MKADRIYEVWELPDLRWRARKRGCPGFVTGVTREEAIAAAASRPWNHPRVNNADNVAWRRIDRREICAPEVAS